MGPVVSRRSVMTLFSKADCPDCHRVRMVLAEKGVNCEIVYPDPARIQEDLLDLNPYGSVPTLVDRDLALYDGRIILEYLDERFPHPPLMPVDPASRARFRIAMLRMERDWYALIAAIDAPGEKTRGRNRSCITGRDLPGARKSPAQWLKSAKNPPFHLHKIFFDG